MNCHRPTKTPIQATRIIELIELRPKTCSRCRRRIVKIRSGQQMQVRLTACHIVSKQAGRLPTTQAWVIATMEVRNFKIIIWMSETLDENEIDSSSDIPIPRTWSIFLRTCCTLGRV